jgi:uncharacterized protein (TIRG00374 family)
MSLSSEPPESRRRRTWSRAVYFAVSVAVTAAVFTYLLRRVSPSEVVDLLRGTDLRGVAMFVVLSFVMSVLRTWRYALLLRVSGHAPPAPALFLVVLVRNFTSDLLPARIGTLVYVYILTGRLGIPFGPAAASFALSFLFDLIALAPLIALAAFFAGAAGGLSATGLAAGAALLLALTLALLAALPALTGFAQRIVLRMRPLAAGPRARLAGALADVEEELHRTRRAGIYDRLLVLSVLVRATKYAGLYVFLFALVAPLGYGLAQLDPAPIFLGLCASELAASLPISGVAGFGAYEGAWALVFRLLGFPGEVADLTAIAHHLFTQVYGYSLGGLALLCLLLPAVGRAARSGSARSAEPALEAGIRFHLRVLGLAGGTAVVLAALYALPSG